MTPSERETLTGRLGRYPADRYPVQHATTQFHLGSALLHAGDVPPALLALATARQLFARAGMALEQAKATVMLGVALRSAGRSSEAVSAFRDAAAALEQLHQPAEQAAAAYDLGLALQDVGDGPSARVAWSTAEQLFLAAGYPAQAGAAAREHGSSLLEEGNAAAALPLLERAAALAGRVRDDAGAAAAANVLGLAHLAVQDPPSAVAALLRALASAPRTVRPGEHAMVKANLALAHEQAGNCSRARLAARQALAVPQAAPPVRAQAGAVLARLPGAAADDLLAVLDDTDRERWPAVVREEVVRVTDAPAAERCVLVRGFLDGVLTRPGSSYDLAQTLLAVLLELPPRAYAQVVEAVVAGCADRPQQEAERVQSVLSSAMARFAVPQWQRLAASLNAAAESSGQPATWR